MLKVSDITNLNVATTLKNLYWLAVQRNQFKYQTLSHPSESAVKCDYNSQCIPIITSEHKD